MSQDSDRRRKARSNRVGEELRARQWVSAPVIWRGVAVLATLKPTRRGSRPIRASCSETPLAFEPKRSAPLQEPQLGPVWEHTSAGWWVVEQNGMLRTGPFTSKERARGWFYKELDIKLSI